MITDSIPQTEAAVNAANLDAIQRVIEHIGQALEWHDQIDRLNARQDTGWFTLGSTLRYARNGARNLRALLTTPPAPAPDTAREALAAAVIAAARELHKRGQDSIALRGALAALDAHDEEAGNG